MGDGETEDDRDEENERVDAIDTGVGVCVGVGNKIGGITLGSLVGKSEGEVEGKVVTDAGSIKDDVAVEIKEEENEFNAEEEINKEDVGIEEKETELLVKGEEDGEEDVLAEMELYIGTEVGMTVGITLLTEVGDNVGTVVVVVVGGVANDTEDDCERADKETALLTPASDLVEDAIPLLIPGMLDNVERVDDWEAKGIQYGESLILLKESEVEWDTEFEDLAVPVFFLLLLYLFFNFCAFFPLPVDFPLLLISLPLPLPDSCPFPFRIVVSVSYCFSSPLFPAALSISFKISAPLSLELTIKRVSFF